MSLLTFFSEIIAGERCICQKSAGSARLAPICYGREFFLRLTKFHCPFVIVNNKAKEKKASATIQSQKAKPGPVENGKILIHFGSYSKKFQS